MNNSNHNYVIFFDDECGICTIGQSKLKKNKFVGDDDVKKLSNITNDQKELGCLIDPQKACNEMAVVNKATKEVNYGWSGIKLLIEEKYPKWKFVNWGFLQSPLSFLYKLIAYNRRVILPLKVKSNTCNPNQNIGLQLTFSFILLFAGLGFEFITETLPKTIVFPFIAFVISQIVITLTFKTLKNKLLYFSASSLMFCVAQALFFIISWATTYFMLLFFIGYLLVLGLCIYWLFIRLFFAENKKLYTLLWIVNYAIYITLSLSEISIF